jgi:hypothetical protein
MPRALGGRRAEANLEAFFEQYASGRRLEKAFKIPSSTVVRKGDVGLDSPGPPFRSMRDVSVIVTTQTLAKIARASCIEAVWVGLALQHIDVCEVSHVSGTSDGCSQPWCNNAKRNWHAESKLAALMWQAKEGPPTLKLRRDSLRSPLRCERRLEVRGFEPLTFSLRTRRSTN